MATVEAVGTAEGVVDHDLAFIYLVFVWFLGVFSIFSNFFKFNTEILQVCYSFLPSESKTSKFS